MNRVLFILGTRPEAIKLNPVIAEALGFFEVKVCLTSQHDGIRSLLPPMEDECVVSLDLVRDESGLCGLTGRIMCLLDEADSLSEWNPELVVVHGDTTSALCGALYAFYKKIRLCHVESGLRSGNKASPFPEESNRKIIDYLSDIHFAPHDNNRRRLEQEGVDGRIHVVGNTIVDVIKKNVRDDFSHPVLDWSAGSEFAIVTLHRRENWGGAIESMLFEMSEFARKNKFKIVYVKNQNPQLRALVDLAFRGNEFVLVSDPLGAFEFHNLLSRSSFVMTDSGGIQEEASFLGKPILILREETERQEIVESGCALLVNPAVFKEALESFFELKTRGLLEMNAVSDIYGSGDSGMRIVQILEDER